LARRLEAEADRRGLTVEQLAVEVLEGRYGAEGGESQSDALGAFVGAFACGDREWATTDKPERSAPKPPPVAPAEATWCSWSIPTSGSRWLTKAPAAMPSVPPF